MNKQKIELIAPTPDLKQEFQALAREYLDYFSQSKVTSSGRSYPFQEALDDFPTFLRKGTIWHGANPAEGTVPMTTFWLVREDNKILGESRLRHSLTPSLEKEGGHIGYNIRPSERRKRYGTLILALTLEKTFEKGITRVLVTCDNDNIASAKIIQKNGGILENETISDRSGKMISRYWIARP